jgi:hypothetical protein
MGAAVAPSRDAHISKSRYGEPGKEPRDLRQQLILKRQRRNMMQHGEAHHSIEDCVRQRHVGGAFAQDGYVLARSSAAELFSKRGVYLDAGQVLDPVSESVRCGTITRTHFKNI